MPSRRRKVIWTPNEADFCRCGGIFLRKMGECSICGAKKSPENRYVPGPHDYTPTGGDANDVTANPRPSS